MGVETREVQIEQTVYTCDFCGEVIPVVTFDPLPCRICGRFFCCGHGESRNDHQMAARVPYCNDCWALGADYRRQMRKIDDEAEAALTKLRQQWKAAARKKAKKK